ncbi:MAG: TolB family protein [Acidimicrobiia bacterium]
MARDVSFDPSPDATGRRIAYRDFHNRIWVHDLVTGDKEMLTPDSEGGAQPVFSPDGSHVAYIGGRSLSVMAADGTDRKALATLGPYNPRPSWSPDSRRIAFHSDLAGGTRIFTINADGTELREVFAGGEHPVWSPDGGSIAFLGGDSRIWIAPAAGGGAYPLTSQGAVASRLSWSPDSRSIAAFVADPEIRKWVLHTFEVHEGTNRREGPPDGDAASTSGTPVWSPDGASIVYQGSCGTTELNNLCLVDRTTGQLRLIDHYAAGGTPLFVP